MVTADIDVRELPGLATKKQVANWAGCSTRQIELQVHANNFPRPIRLGLAPRWRRSDLLRWLKQQADEACSASGMERRHK